MLIRSIAASDIPQVTALMAELGYPTEDTSLARRLAAVARNPEDDVLIAEDEGTVLGLVAVHSYEMLHRPGRLGRITALVVAGAARRRGVARDLMAVAEQRLRALGCIKLEVTSAAHRSAAHAFYGSLGYEEQRVHFVKNVQT
jgi:ribosomal protein S18 acetylase RimI-like enzyme